MDKLNEAAIEIAAKKSFELWRKNLNRERMEEVFRELILAGVKFEQERDKWVDANIQLPTEGQDCIFIVEAKGDYMDGRVLGGRYNKPHVYNGQIKWHEFTTPGCGWTATLWQPLPANPLKPTKD